MIAVIAAIAIAIGTAKPPISGAITPTRLIIELIENANLPSRIKTGAIPAITAAITPITASTFGFRFPSHFATLPNMPTTFSRAGAKTAASCEPT